MSYEDSYPHNASATAFKKLEDVHGNVDDLEEPYRTIVRICSAQGIIDNGGLIYFFEADWPGNPPYSDFADAYRRIGRSEAADSIEFAAASFGIPFPERNKEFRNEFMEKQFGIWDVAGNWTEGEWTVEWDDCICGDEEVWDCLTSWLRVNYPQILQ
jgi:hypothetical protein